VEPLTSMPIKRIREIKALFFDLDGTFVGKDVLRSEAYNYLEKLNNKGVKTVAVTGRSAGWCDLMARWWPVSGVIGENGALYYSKVDGKIVRETYNISASLSNSQDKLHTLFGKLVKRYEYLKLASDQAFRQWDIAIDISEETEVPVDVALDIVKFCEKRGARASISNIHVNVWFGDYNKENMSLKIINDYGLDKENVIYIGDSPNDSPMFGCFPLSVGVSSVSNYKDIIDNHPKYVCSRDGDHGFVELADFILSTK
jgi:HAD superfamily hydrolase (TIGR01484 family)